MERLLTEDQVLRYLRVKHSSLWHGCQTGRYPKPVRLGAGSVRWRESEVRAAAIAQAQMLTSKQAAYLLGVTPATLLKGARMGTYPKPVIYGQRVFRWHHDEIQRFISKLVEL